MEDKLDVAIAKINNLIEFIKRNDLYPAYCLNAKVDGLQAAIEIIEDVKKK